MAALAAVMMLAAASLLWQSVVQPQDRFWEAIEARGAWRVGMDPSFPPFEDLDEAGRPVGFDVDLARAIAARWGLQADIESIGFDGLIDVVWASKIDAVISAMPYQPQFSQDVHFSRPYFEAGLVMVLPAVADEAIQTVEDLAGRRVAVEWGAEGDVQARSLRRRFPDLQILPLETAQAALEAVVGGEADAAFVDHISALAFAGAGQPVRISQPALVSEPYVIVMPRKAPILHRQVDEALNALEADGSLDRLVEKWFR